MNKRIRYIKDGDLLRSVRFIPTPNGEAIVRINPNNNTAVITVGEHTEELAASSLHQVKIAVKASLKHWGAVFEEEKRNVVSE